MPSSRAADIDAVAHEVAVALLDDIAEMNAYPKLDALLGRHASALRSTTWRVWTSTAQRTALDNAVELDDRAVAGALDDAAVMHGDDRVRSGRCEASGAAPACGLHPPRRKPAVAPATSDTRIAAIFRVSSTRQPPATSRIAQRRATAARAFWRKVIERKDGSREPMAEARLWGRLDLFAYPVGE